jgi:signal transduction histidine kinase/CheY-like chemotaxis protein/ligand-binding sensor protein
MSLEKLHILSVEDNPADHRLLKEHLKESFPSGFEIAWAQTVKDAVKCLSSKKFDVILLDLGLPDSMGLDGLEKLQAVTPAVPIIVLTGLTDEKAGSLALEKNAQDYLVKGKVLPDTLARSINYSIQRKKSEEALRESEERIRVKLQSIISPEGNLGNLELADIIDSDAIQTLMNTFYELSPMPMALIDTKGKVLVGVGWQDICTKFHRVNPETCRYCIESDTQLTADVEKDKFKIYRCKNGMWDVSTPIIIGGRHIGNIFTGQFFFKDETPDYEFFKAQAKKYGFNEKSYLEALDRAPRLSKESVNSAMAFFLKFAHMTSQLGYSNAKIARALVERDGLIAERKLSEEQLQKLNKALIALNRSDQAMLRATNESEYLEEICGNIVTNCGYAMAWIGYTQDDELKTVRPVAQAGFEKGYLKTIKISWADNELGRGPTGTAIRTGKPSLCRNMQSDPKFAPWRKDALERGYASSMVLPLLEDGKAFGALSIYSKDPDPFSDDELALINKLAEDLSFGIKSIRLRGEKALVEAMLKKAHDELEDKVRLRTSELIAANTLLNDEINKRRDKEKQIYARNVMLKLWNQSSGRKEYVNSAVKLLKGWTMFRGVGIRILDDESRLPYESQAGFTKKFLEKENVLFTGAEQCICARVVTGAPERSEKPYLTKTGAFRCSDTFLFLENLSNKDKQKFRGACMKCGFRSLIVAPIRHRDRTIGVIHLVDDKPDKATDEVMEFIEGISQLIGEGIYKFILEEKISRDRVLLEQGKRLSDIGTLSATVAHELRNPLAAINMASWNIRKKANNPLIESHIQNIQKKVLESEQIINNLLFYSRLKPPHFEKIKIADILNECAEHSKEKSKTRVSIGKHFSVLKDTVLEIDPLQIREVFNNVLNNAMDALPEKGGKIGIDGGADHATVKIRVSDNGKGIDKPNLSRVFDTFFSTKAKGTGLGLSVCKQIIDFHGGTINIESEPGKGTAVTVVLPKKH